MLCYGMKVVKDCADIAAACVLYFLVCSRANTSRADARNLDAATAISSFKRAIYAQQLLQRGSPKVNGRSDRQQPYHD